MGTRPQTAGYGLQDSPVGLAAWIYEKIAEWTQSNRQPETVLTRDEILDNITLYWLTGTATSSSTLYAESFTTDNTTQKLNIPVAVSVFPCELFRRLKLWGERVLFKSDLLEQSRQRRAFRCPRTAQSVCRGTSRQLRHVALTDQRSVAPADIRRKTFRRRNKLSSKGA